jgi:hypothetical protein
VEIGQALRKALPDILAGAIFIAFGLFFALTSLTYDVGTPFQMGPGFFPLILGGVLVLLGVIVVGSGFAADREGGVGTFPWRGMVLIPVAFIFFGLTVRGLGIIPALFITTLLASFSSERLSVVMAVAVAVGLTALSIAIFVIALQLHLPLLGPWLAF